MKVWGILLGFLLLIAPYQEEPVIEWSPGRSIEWDDFRGLPEPKADAAATTVSALSYRFKGYLQGEELIYEYEVKALFFPEKSWVRNELKDDELLLHERLHFDITAWYANRLRQAFDTITPVADPQESIREVYELVRAELNAVQEQYDRETDFSRDTKAQLLWRSRVKAYLTESYE